MRATLCLAVAAGSALLVGCAGPAPSAAPAEVAACGMPALAGGDAGHGPFADWTAVVVAADDTASDGGTTRAFDNARRELARNLVAIGFAPGRTAEFSKRCGAEPGDRAGPLDPRAMVDALAAAPAADAGCLIYLTSHGSPEGIVFGEAILTPDDLDRMLDVGCGARPTIAVVSACYSGVFAREPVAAANRLILTAARSDRPSFGCGGDDLYPLFDRCVIASLQVSPDLATLLVTIGRCVSQLEARLGVREPSMPQLAVGDEVWPLLDELRFSPPAP